MELDEDSNKVATPWLACPEEQDVVVVVLVVVVVMVVLVVVVMVLLLLLLLLLRWTSLQAGLTIGSKKTYLSTSRSQATWLGRGG